MTPSQSNNAAINQWLVQNKICIIDNPAISPDLTLDWPQLQVEIQAELGTLQGINDSPLQTADELKHVTLFPKSEFSVNGIRFWLLESRKTGDAAFLISGAGELPLEGIVTLGSLRVTPLWWENLISLKNFVLESDPASTIFPKAAGSLSHSSLGIGARFTTQHWPGVAWAMKNLNVSLTANQNSIPRELVYDVDAMLEGSLSQVPFPFIGGSVPEGHQGQSVQGMTHASILSYMKMGFHRNGIAWGFNADHQPIGGRYDAIEKQLVSGSVFASYITYDLSPELSLSQPIADETVLEAEFEKLVDANTFQRILSHLEQLDIPIDLKNAKRLVTYITPSMEKMRKRDTLYTLVRKETFSTEGGRAFFKELSIDELPGETTTDTLAICLAMAEAMQVKFNFVAPNIGFQKNFPYPDNAELKIKVNRLYSIAKKFGVSIGFHSGSGKSAQNYRVIGETTGGNLEIKTSGRYTYEMGVALSHSKNADDQRLWRDWYHFTRELALAGAFSENATQRRFARDFIEKTFEHENKAKTGIFDSSESLHKALHSLAPSPDHMFWFEYNFLYVLAAEGSSLKLGDHSPLGYAQRRRFYTISEEGKLNYARCVARYILFLAETTGLASTEQVADAKEKLEGYLNFAELVEDAG